MPFNIDYGPISTAMGLAAQGGQAQAAQTGFQDQMALQQHLLQSQQAAANQRAQEISLSLEAQRNQNQQQLALAQMHNEAAYRQAYLGGMNQYHQGTVAVRQQQADTQQQRVGNTADYQQGMLGVQQQKLQQVQDYQDWEQQHGDTLASSQQAQQLDAQIKTLLGQGLDLNSPQVAPLWQQLQQADQAMKQPHTKRQRGGPPQAIGEQPTSQNIPATAPAGQSQTGYDLSQGANAAPGSRGPITPDIASIFLQQANGDPNKARQLAAASGWSF